MMKKKLLLLTYIVFIFACVKAQTKPESLTGVDSITCQAMIGHFNIYKAIDLQPKPTNIWISKKVINNIYSLLMKEYYSEKPQRGTGTNTGDDIIGMTDGIRVYFSSDPKINDNRLHTSIVLVSTKDAGIDTAQPIQSHKLHHDYWQHSTSVNLSITALDETIYNDGNGTVGDVLYNTCTNCPIDSSCISLPNNITREKAENMVQNFNSHVVNTVSEWFPLNLIKYLVQNTRMDGIRIYFSTHTTNDTLYPTRDAFIITTTEIKGGVHTDYFDCGTSKMLKEVGFVLDPPQDNGEICPSHCN